MRRWPYIHRGMNIPPIVKRELTQIEELVTMIWHNSTISYEIAGILCFLAYYTVS